MTKLVCCQPSEAHPGRMHLTETGRKTLCGRTIKGTTWNTPWTPSQPLEQCFDGWGEHGDDCRLCAKSHDKASEPTTCKPAHSATKKATVSPRAAEYLSLVPHINTRFAYETTKENIQWNVPANEQAHVLAALDAHAQSIRII